MITSPPESSPAAKILGIFGGASRLARLLGMPASTVGHWKTTGLIPCQHQAPILSLARSRGLLLTADDFIRKQAPEPRVDSIPTGPEMRAFSTEPVSPPQPLVPGGHYLQELLKLSETRLVLCFVGVGSAFAKRNDQTSLIIAKNRKTILVDVGSTIPQALYRHGMDITAFDFYHLTHAHSDHIGGLEELLLKHRYILGKKAKLIISPHFQRTLWEHSLKGGCEVNELGLLKFTDLIDPIEPDWVKNQPRETYQITVGGIHLTIFRTIHTPGDVTQWEKAFWSTGMVIDGKVLFSADTRFDPGLFTDIPVDQIDAIFHDCQLFNPGKVHAAYDELKGLPASIRAKMFLTHYGDSFSDLDPTADGFAGYAQPFVPYTWPLS
jgi:ribonuclease BN (tRNA processing enzyme)